jgi:hypothetical protein
MFNNIESELRNSFDGGAGNGLGTLEIEESYNIDLDEESVDWQAVPWKIRLNAQVYDKTIVDKTFNKLVSYKTEFVVPLDVSTHRCGVISHIWVENLKNQNELTADKEKEIKNRVELLSKDADATDEERKEVLRDFVQYCYQLDISTDEIIWNNGTWDLSNLSKYLPPFFDPVGGNVVTEINFWGNEL